VFLTDPARQLTQEWLYRPRDVNLCEPQLDLWLVGRESSELRLGKPVHIIRQLDHRCIPLPVQLDDKQ